ncbi:MAG: hypothetical protein AAGB19_16150 [Cyanobacteria bacterium P01_F01_bin.3]
MLSPNDLQTLQLMCRTGLSGSDTDIADVFDLLGFLDEGHKRQFWNWLRQHDKLLQSRLKRAKQRLEATPPKPKPWYAERLRRARGA